MDIVLVITIIQIPGVPSVDVEFVSIILGVAVDIVVVDDMDGFIEGIEVGSNVGYFVGLDIVG